MSRRTSIVSAILLSTALVAGCSSASTPSASPTGATPGTATTSEAPPAKAGGTLTYAVAGGGLTHLDPHKLASAALLPLVNVLYSGLTTFGPDMSIEPDLAESWSASSDQKTWTFKLRQGVKFHDGKEFTAEIAAKNITRVLDKETGSQARARLSTIESVKAVDATTLEIQLSAPNAILPTAITAVKFADVDNIAKVNENANGTGPYKLKEFVPDDHVTLVPNADYWGDKPKLDEIKIVTAADTTAAVTSLRNKELDVVWNVPPLDVKTLKEDPGLQVNAPPAGSGNVIWEVDTTSAPFDNVKARQALAYSFDRKQLLDVGYDGIGVASEANVPINPASDAFNKDLTLYSKDLDKAKALFAEAGVKEGTKLTFWTTAGRNPQWVVMAQVLQQDLKSIGIELDIQQNEPSTWLEKFFPAGKTFPGTLIANYLSTPMEPSLALNFFRKGICECNWTNPEYDQLFAEAVANGDEKARNEIYAKLQKIINEEVPIIIAINTSQISVSQKRVTGMWVQSDGTLRLEDAGVTD